MMQSYSGKNFQSRRHTSVYMHVGGGGGGGYRKNISKYNVHTFTCPLLKQLHLQIPLESKVRALRSNMHETLGKVKNSDQA